MTDDAVRRAIEAAWRIEAPRIVARVARLTGDVGAAEDLTQDALLAALEQWPRDGIPDNPGAWLMTAARRKAIDLLRRRGMLDRRHAALHVAGDDGPDVEAALAASLDDPVGDEMLRLIFTACHPVLKPEARVALTLRLVGGLTTDEIARAFLVPSPTLGQRIVRAKRTLAEARVPYEVPGAAELPARLASVLEVVYAIFNEGYSASAGAEWYRRDLCHEALRLGRVLARLLPDEAEVHGLVALMELQASRLGARTDADGRPILLPEQDRSRWDRLLIGRGFAALEAAERSGRGLGPYGLQAAIAACHARARSHADTDWERMAALYDALAQLTPGPVVELNRAVAHGMAFGPETGLAMADALSGEPALRSYHYLPAVRAEFLGRLGRRSEAAREYRRAADMTANAREREALVARAGEMEV